MNLLTPIVLPHVGYHVAMSFLHWMIDWTNWVAQNTATLSIGTYQWLPCRHVFDRTNLSILAESKKQNDNDDVPNNSNPSPSVQQQLESNYVNEEQASIPDVSAGVNSAIQNNSVENNQIVEKFIYESLR